MYEHAGEEPAGFFAHGGEAEAQEKGIGDLEYNKTSDVVVGVLDVMQGEKGAGEEYRIESIAIEDIINPSAEYQLLDDRNPKKK